MCAEKCQPNPAIHYRIHENTKPCSNKYFFNPVGDVCLFTCITQSKTGDQKVIVLNICIQQNVAVPTVIRLLCLQCTRIAYSLFCEAYCSRVYLCIYVVVRSYVWGEVLNILDLLYLY